MKSVLVSLISGQTIPNLLLIKEFAAKYDELLFITTVEMEGRGNFANSRSRWIERSCKIAEGSSRRIEVAEDSWTDITEKLNSLGDSDDIRYMVNLTGGTKIMTLAVFEYFSRPGNIIYYIPFPKNEYHELFPNRNSHINKLKYRCNLEEYLLAHGLFFQTNNEILAPIEHTNVFFEKIKAKKFNLLEIPEISLAHDMADPQLKSYYSGGWFEEYFYHLLSERLKLNEKKIALNIKLSRNPDDINNDNEYDVMFVKSNALYVIEAKVSVGLKPSSTKLRMDQILYKLGAITRDFGLRVNSYVATLNHLVDETGKLSSYLEKRCRLLGVKGIIEQSNFKNTTEITNKFK